MPPTGPETLGRYQLLECISVGSTTEVHRARAEGVGGFRRLFALKRVRPALAGEEGLVDQLVDEARTAGLLSHANIVQIMDLGEQGGTYTVAMEFVDGPDLSAVLHRCMSRNIRFPIPHAARITIELLKALDYIHSRTVMRGNSPQPLNIVHLGIAPENVLLSWQGEVKLTDFGSARSSIRSMHPVPPSPSAAHFRSLEARGKGPVDHRSDLFSTALLLCTMLVGHNPLDGTAETPAAEALTALRSGSRGPLANLPAELRDIVVKGLAPREKDRFQTSNDMRTALEGFIHTAGYFTGPSSLSTFLRQLFPDRGQRRAGGPQVQSPASDSDPPTQPFEEEQERPTSPNAKAPASHTRRAHGLRDLSQSKRFGPAAASRPLHSRPEEPDLATEEAAEWNDAPTRIRGPVSVPAPEEVHLPPPVSDAPRRAPRPTVQRSPSPIQHAAPLPRHQPRDSSATAFWGFIALLAAGMVLGLGFLLGLRVSTWSASQQKPTLQIVGPAAAKAYVDGRLIDTSTPTPLDIGPHSVEITHSSGSSTTVQVQLAPGETRILTVQSVTETRQAQP